MIDANRVFFIATGILLGVGIVVGFVTLLANVRVFKAINNRLQTSGRSLSWFSYTNSWKVDPRLREIAPTEFATAYRLKWVTLGCACVLAISWLVICLVSDAMKHKVRDSNSQQIEHAEK
jgi:hypothetical protein